LELLELPFDYNNPDNTKLNNSNFNTKQDPNTSLEHYLENCFNSGNGVNLNRINFEIFDSFDDKSSNASVSSNKRPLDGLNSKQDSNKKQKMGFSL
jgi:hypothetical protein